MNERIKAIAEHCDFYVGNEHFNKSHEEYQKIWTEKFAEIIIRECAGVAEVSMPVNSYPDDRLTVKNNVLKHFGVEG